MWPYYFVVIYAFVFVTIIMPKLKEQNNIKLFFLMVPIFLVAVMRGNGSGDYFNYIDRGQYLYSWHDVVFRNIGMEIGYKILAYITKLLSLPRQTVIIIMNMISFFALNKFIKRYSVHWSMSVLLFLPLFFQFEMHAARSGVAISIIALGYRYIEERKLLNYLVVVLLASLFHTTAIVAIIIYYIYSREVKLKWGCIVMGFEMLLVAFTGVDEVISHILNFFHLNTFLAKYMTYVNSQEFGYSLNLYDPRILIGILVYIAVALLMKNKTKMDNFLINCIYIYSFLLILFSEHTFIAYRISSFFYYPMIILIPNFILKFKVADVRNRDKIVYFYGIMLLFTVLNFVYASQLPEYVAFWKNGLAILPWI